MMQVCTTASDNTALTASGKPNSVVADDEEHVLHATVPDVGEHGHPVLRGLPVAVAGTHRQDVLAAIEVDRDRGIERLRADLPVTDFPVITSMKIAA